MSIKVDLLNHPYFFSPPHEGKTSSLQERVMAHLSPSFQKIVDRYYDSDMDVVGLASCQTETSGRDYRWQDYLSQPPEGYCIGAFSEDGFCTFIRLGMAKKLTILHGQKVRAYLGERPVYAYALGLGKLVKPTRDLVATLEDIKGGGGLAFVCDPFLLEVYDEVKQIKRALLDGVCIGSYAPVERAIGLKQKLEEDGIPAIPVSGNHGYKNIGTSFMHLNAGLFSLDGLPKTLREGRFNPYFGHTNAWKKLLARDIHIWASAPFHLSARGARAAEFLKLWKFRKGSF